MSNASKDHSIALGLLDGNREALEELYIKYAPQVRVFVYHYAGNHADAEDITHDIFLKIWSRRSSIRVGDNLSSLIFTMARNAVLDAVKHRRIEARYVEQQLLQSEIEPAHDMESSLHAKEEVEFLEKKIVNLPDRQRRVFEMSRVEGKTYEEISRELHISEKITEERTVVYH